YHPALNQQVNAILKAKGTIADTDLVQTYEKHLSPTRLTERIDLVGSQVKGEIDQVTAMIDAAAGSASSYSESLAGATEQIVRSKDRDGLRTIVEIVQTTKTMEISTVNLKKD
ncbi:MAG: GGDEF domain-containing protein, partial [Pseudolabrys sp.]